MLYKFIGRNGKRKPRKVTELRSHPKQSSELPQVATPLVFDINEASLVARSSPLVELTFSNTDEEWFPRDLLRSRSSTPELSPQRVRNATVTQSNSAQQAPANTSPVPSFSHSETSSSLPARKKSIPAPIMIPDHVVPNVQIGHSALPSQAFPTKLNASGAPGNSPSASMSDNLSAVSGTTLARALIASSFVLSSERRSSRHRSGVARQDSATLPRGSFFLSDSKSSSPIPPVPPVPAMLANTTPNSSHPHTAVNSGTSTQSEYPMSDSYTTSPETADSSAIPRRTSRIQERPLPILSTLSKGPLAVPTTRSQRKAGPIPSRSRVPKHGVFDGPKTAIEVSLPFSSRETTRRSSQEGSALLTSGDYSLDEFDFMPPEGLVVLGSPASDSSVSYISRRRGDTLRGQWRRKAGGLDRAQNNSKNSSSADSAVSHQTPVVSSATTSEHDFGELLHYDLISPESSTSLSSASAGYQTFPETPMVFSPLYSSGFAFFAKSDIQVAHRHITSLRSAGRGSSKAHPSLKPSRRQVGNNDGGSISPFLSSKQKPPSPKEAEAPLPLPVPVIDDGTNQPPTTDTTKAQLAEESLSIVRPHPLAHISSTSSYLLEEEALRALAQRSFSSSPCIDIGNDEPSFDPTAKPVSIVDLLSANSPMSIPLPESTDASLSNSPALPAVFSLASHSLQPSATAVNQSFQPNPPPPSLSSSLGGPESLPSASMSSALRDESPLRPHSVTATTSSSLSPNGLGSHSPSLSPSFVPPSPFHTLVLERTSHHPSSSLAPSLSRTPSADPLSQRSRQASNSSLASGSARTRARSRPPLPIGPRKQSRPGHGVGSFFSGIRGRNSSTSSVASNDPAVNAGFSWHKLRSAASKPSPKFQAPPRKWRGLTLEAAQWTFTSAQLQEIVSQAIQHSFEGSSLRFVRPEILEGEIADELQRLELQHIKVKSQYKELTQKRWILMGALAGHVEGVDMNDVTMAIRTVEELAEILSMLDHHTEQMHDIVLQMAELQRLRDVHNTSALALVVRKINGLFVRQMAEKERLQGQVDTLAVERDEAWKHAEDIAQDYDILNDRVSEESVGDANKILSDAQSMTTSSRRSTRISIMRKSSARQSQVGLRSQSRRRDGRRSPSNSGRPTSLPLVDIPPVPRLPVNLVIGTSALPTTGMSFGSVCDTWETSSSASLALAEAQREVYEMLGLSLPPSQSSSRRRTLSGPASPTPSPSPSVRPVSDSFDRDKQRVRSRQEYRRVTRSVTLSDRFYHVRPLTVA